MTKRFWSLALFLIIIVQQVYCQSAYITGIVKDSLENQPIPYASVYVKGTRQGVICSVDGKFTVAVPTAWATIRVQAVNYKTREFELKAGDRGVILNMESSTRTLDEVVIRKHREHYVKKGNPAVAFIEKVRSHMKDQDPFEKPYYSYDKYEQMTFGLNDLGHVDKNLIMRSFKGAVEYLDSSEVTGKMILPVSLNETVSTDYFRKSPSTHKQLITARQHAGFDEDFDYMSIKKFMDDAFREINIYGNDINFMQNRFVSPLSKIGPNFYKYYLVDTVDVEGVKCVELDFVPFNTESFGFIGRMYFAVDDTSMFLKKLSMNIPRRINLNYVEHVYVTQEFVKGDDGCRHKTHDDVTIEFKVLTNTQGLYARRNTFYSNFSTAQPRDMAIFDMGGEQIVAHGADRHDKAFWVAARPAGIKHDEGYMHALMKKLRSSKLFYWGEKCITTLAQGYVATGNPSKFDFGALNTFINSNELEGFRMRVGGMTTAHLNPHWFSRWHVAYGFKDKKVKYSFNLEYSFNKKRYHSMEFPIHSIKFTTSYDLDKIGQNYLYTSQDNAVLMIRRHRDDKINYLRLNQLEYKLELPNGFSVAAAIEHDMHEASHLLPFVDGNGRSFAHYHEAGFSVTLRYAPGEKFYQTRSYRFPINIDNPIVTLKHTYMPKHFVGNNFEINKTEIGLQKRFWFSAWGYTDIILKGAKIWSRVPYPELLYPNANITYTIQPESFSLLNAMEYVTDQNVQWDVTYWMNGAIMNYVPLLKRLKLREVVSFRGIYGSLLKKNDPVRNQDLYRFPERAHTVGLGSKPYMEIGVGLDNILTFLRVDWVWRLTYRNVKGVDRQGLRVSLHFAF
ncbi:DUF5686 and carboxypeptidase-like regulatory domain-containing protein [Sodaliphilus pleomorphus]|uniref:Carboxypeptidase-like regulatory domain-containing protein n=1 Tax=Sodaliphilus pleomorphus TaxID=2606626 RepID=A0A6L5XBR7_9BACT|nr:DUF5686 and carboxypeptidase-like regulatory domain-containing protein [Sodaliphilus pleomorphus]MSS17899.1 carboxypeptidase-like regulatory domain-containing protein [Sodaliphilus pleomorphus]